MAISYKKLWKLLIDKDMTAVELREKTGIAPNTMTKLRRDEEVSLTVLVKICTALNANIGDIMDLIPDSDLYAEERK
jgi:DNA-binding Xre family transcriptional regulator